MTGYASAQHSPGSTTAGPEGGKGCCALNHSCTMIFEITERCVRNAAGPCFVYAYWPEVDSIAHERGALARDLGFAPGIGAGGPTDDAQREGGGGETAQRRGGEGSAPRQR